MRPTKIMTARSRVSGNRSSRKWGSPCRAPSRGQPRSESCDWISQARSPDAPCFTLAQGMQDLALSQVPTLDEGPEHPSSSRPNFQGPRFQHSVRGGNDRSLCLICPWPRSREVKVKSPWRWSRSGSQLEISRCLETNRAQVAQWPAIPKPHLPAGSSGSSTATTPAPTLPLAARQVLGQQGDSSPPGRHHPCEVRDVALYPQRGIE